MKILQNAGTATIKAITLPVNINFEDETVWVVDQGTDTLSIIKQVGTNCYKSEDRTTKTPEQFAKMLLKRGHTAMIEFVDVIVYFQNVSRGFTHELVRHRLCSFAQESTRYVDPSKSSGYNFILPPDKDPHEKIDNNADYDLSGIVEMYENIYRILIEAGWKTEDARQFLPIGIKSDIYCKANLTEWRHIFDLRTAKPAHWEIRYVMGNLLEQMKKLFSPIFNDYVIKGQCIKGINYYEKI